MMLPLLFSDTWILNFPTSDFLHTHDNDVDNEDKDDNDGDDDDGEDEDDNDSPSQTSASVTRVRGCMAQSVNARRAPCKSNCTFAFIYITLHTELCAVWTFKCVLCGTGAHLCIHTPHYTHHRPLFTHHRPHYPHDTYESHCVPSSAPVGATRLQSKAEQRAPLILARRQFTRCPVPGRVSFHSRFWGSHLLTFFFFLPDSPLFLCE